MNQNPNKFDIIRSVSKDKYYRLLQFNQLKLILNKFNYNHVHLLSDSLYYFLTTLLNRQTLGEECYNLIFYNHKSKNLHNFGKRLTLIVFKIFIPYFLFKQKIKYFFIIYIIRLLYLVIKRINKIIFYFNYDQSFNSIENRLTHTKYLSLDPKSPSNQNQYSIRFIGIVKILDLLVNLIHSAKNLWSVKSNSFFSKPVTIQTVINQSSKVKCSICLDNVNGPTVIQCGHIFCWYCIQSYVVSLTKNSSLATCPTCRLKIDHNKLVYLNNY